MISLLWEVMAVAGVLSHRSHQTAQHWCFSTSKVFGNTWYKCYIDRWFKCSPWQLCVLLPFWACLHNKEFAQSLDKKLPLSLAHSESQQSTQPTLLQGKSTWVLTETPLHWVSWPHIANMCRLQEGFWSWDAASIAGTLGTDSSKDPGSQELSRTWHQITHAHLLQVLEMLDAAWCLHMGGPSLKTEFW